MPYINVEELPSREPVQGFSGKFVHAENMTVAHWRIQALSMAPLHSHPHEQVSFVIEGEFELTVAGEPMTLKPGISAVIPAGVEHSGIAITDCYLVDIFHPVRDDYR